MRVETAKRDKWRVATSLCRRNSVRRRPALALNHLDGHGSGFAAADAKAGNSAASARQSERRKQGDQNARSGSADRVTEGAGAAVYVDLVVIESHVPHGGHDSDRKRLVDFPQIYAGRRPSNPGQQLLHRARGRGGKQSRLLSVGGVPDDSGERLDPKSVGA